VSPPEEEARRLYLEPSRLQDRLSKSSEVVIWDVGLGAASNAMAVIEAHSGPGKIRIESFEIDLDPLRLALKNPHLFRHLRSPAPHALLRDARWGISQSTSGSAILSEIEWRLFEGDFMDRMKDAARPDVIFFDPFSPKVDAPLWSRECFRRIFAASRNDETMLMTYSVSTMVRAMLLAEGFYVGSGAASGPKSETTVAYRGRPGQDSGAKLLGAEWLQRWERSSAKVPTGLNSSEQATFEALVRSHPQFRNSGADHQDELGLLGRTQ